MHAMKAQVRNGHLVVDEPTELPEGSERRREGQVHAAW